MGSGLQGEYLSLLSQGGRCPSRQLRAPPIPATGNHLIQLEHAKKSPGGMTATAL